MNITWKKICVNFTLQIANCGTGSTCVTNSSASSEISLTERVKYLNNYCYMIWIITYKSYDYTQALKATNCE